MKKIILMPIGFLVAYCVQAMNSVGSHKNQTFLELLKTEGQAVESIKKAAAGIPLTLAINNKTSRDIKLEDLYGKSALLPSGKESELLIYFKTSGSYPLFQFVTTGGTVLGSLRIVGYSKEYASAFFRCADDVCYTQVGIDLPDSEEKVKIHITLTLKNDDLSGSWIDATVAVGSLE